MASSITLSGDWLVSLGNRQMTMGSGNLGTYAAGGVVVTPNQVGLGVIDELIVDSAGGYVFRYDKAAGKVMAFQDTDPAAAGGSNIPLVEVGATDISSAVFRFQAIGR
jgi:hypothetical protein